MKNFSGVRHEWCDVRIKLFLGVGLAVAGAVLSIFFWELEFGWFRGGPLGVLLMVVGAYQAGEELWRSRGRARKNTDEGPGGADGGEATRRHED